MAKGFNSMAKPIVQLAMNSEKYLSARQNFLLVKSISKKPNTIPPITRLIMLQVMVINQGKTKVTKAYPIPANRAIPIIVVATFFGSENHFCLIGLLIKLFIVVLFIEYIV